MHELEPRGNFIKQFYVHTMKDNEKSIATINTFIDEAKKYTALLGYNYQSSDWYERSYKILNTNYEKPQIKKDLNKQKSLLKKFKQLFQ